MLSTSSSLSPSPARGVAATSLAPGSGGAPGSPSSASEGEGSTFGAFISVLVGPASDADDSGPANQAGSTSEVEAEPIGEALKAVDSMAAELPPPFILAPIATPLAPPVPTLAILSGIAGLGAEISGSEPEAVLGEAVATEEPSSTGDTSFESPSIRSLRGDGSLLSAPAALHGASGRAAAHGAESKPAHGKAEPVPEVGRDAAFDQHGHAAALSAGALSDATAVNDGLDVSDGDALLDASELPTSPLQSPSVVAEADGAAAALAALALHTAQNTVSSVPACQNGPAGEGATSMLRGTGPAESQRGSAAVDFAAAALGGAAPTGAQAETTRAVASAAGLVAPGALPLEGGSGPNLEGGHRVRPEESGERNVAHQAAAAATAAAMNGALADSTDEQASGGNSQRSDRRSLAAAQLRDLVADRTGTRVDAPTDDSAGSLSAGAAAPRHSPVDPIMSARADVGSASDEMAPSVMPAASPWATAEPAALDSGLGGAHANQRFTSMLAHAEELQGPEHVSKQVVRALYLQWRDGVGEAHVQLSPEHLGQVTLSLKVERGGVVATVVAETETAQRWIESHRDSLQQSLGEQGLKLDRLMVTTSREGRREQPADDPGQRPRRQNPRRTSQGIFEVRV